jgi:hypothetical protein
MPPDVETAFLAGLLDFARKRLDALLNTLASDADALLQSLVPGAPPLDPGVAAAVDAHLNTARGHFTQLAADIAAGPSTLSDCQQAFTEAVGALSEVDAAIRAIAAAVPAVGDAETAILTMLQRAVAGGGDAVSGILDQLGLSGSISDHVAIAGTRITFPLANAAARNIGPLALQSTTALASLDYGGTPQLGVSLTTGLAIGLVSDAFVGQILGAQASATSTLTVNVDTTNGLRFQAGAKGRAELDGQLAVPGVQLSGLGIEIPDGQPFGLALTGTITGSLGPIAAVIQGAGVAIVYDQAQRSISLDFQAPTGAGVSVDAGPIHGGGFVQHVGTTYGGALDLSLGPIEIKAVGLVDTQPFSLVLVLSVDFLPAIQLSFGFTLNAVGGLLAIERTVATDVLRAGVHDHTTDTVLFPKDPVAAAPTILTALAQMFPPQSDAFVAGPMLELGWGSPVSFVTARLGVIIALPDPKVILLGSLRMALPVPDAPIVDLRAEIYGEITPDHLLFLVSLSGSQIAGFPITGDFGVLIAWGDHPDLALSAGGFHPHYNPPGELAGMRRVSIDLSPPALLTLRTEAYVALTSNSFQLGTRIELKAEVAGVGAEGHLQFDALVLWAPTFHFEIDLSAGVSLYAFGESFASVDLSLHLEGPGPWVATGHAGLSLLFFDVDFDLPRLQWGSGANPTSEPAHPQQLVQAALSDSSAWEARLPADTNRLARLVDLSDESGTIVHPLGALEARQSVVPLETTIQHIGAHPVDTPRINLGQPAITADGMAGLTAKAISNATDLFSPGNFLDLTEDQKLSRPAFEPFPAGIVMAAETATYGTPQGTSYEWFTLVPPEPTLNQQPFVSLKALNSVLLTIGPAGLVTAVAAASGNPYSVPEEAVTVADPGTSRVRSPHDLGVVPGLPVATMTTANAAEVVEGVAAGSAQLVGLGVGS